jgi:DNA modification methylase
MRCVEEILVWTNRVKYNPQRVGKDIRIVKSRAITRYVNKETLTTVKPQTVVGRYQTHLISTPRTLRGFATRPDNIIELFINSYTNEGDIILDPTCYKGLSGRIAIKLKRRWIGIDKYFYPEELMTATAAAAGAGSEIITHE